MLALLVKMTDVMLDETNLTLKEQADIGIVIQEPWGGKEPAVLTKVLHSKAFIKQAAAMKVQLDLPKELQNEVESDANEGSNVDEDSEAETKVLKRPRAVKKATKVRDREAYVDLDSDSDADVETQEIRRRSKRQRRAKGQLDDSGSEIIVSTAKGKKKETEHIVESKDDTSASTTRPETHDEPQVGKAAKRKSTKKRKRNT